MKLASEAWMLHLAFSMVPRRGNHGDCFGTEMDELRRDSGEWGERGAQRPDCYDFVQGYSWGEQPGSQVLLWEGRAALFLESWCPLKPCPGFAKQSVLRARWEHSEVGVKKPSSGIILAFQGQHHSLNFIKVETNARIQMTSPENPPIEVRRPGFQSQSCHQLCDARRVAELFHWPPEGPCKPSPVVSSN